MIVLAFLAVCYLARQGIQALPIPKTGIVPRSHASIDNCDNLTLCRTTWNITWSCVATIFACTWVALHMNIPGPDEKWLTIALRKVRVMALALIAPELVVVLAMRQWLVARRIAKEHRRTKTHGFFVLMGGFVRFEGDEGPYILSPEDIRPHLRKNDITEKDIQDRSKGDMLSKGFAVLQTSWFILQCIARQFQGLPITELEIVTLAFAILNFATYGLWWNKPLDVQVPFFVGGRPTFDEEVYEDMIECDDGGWWDTVKRAVASMWRAIEVAIMRTLPGAISNAVKVICKTPGAVGKALRHATIHRHFGLRSAKNALKTLGRIAIFTIIASFPVMLNLLKMGAAYDDVDIKPKTKRVSTFHSGKLKFDGGERTRAIFVSALFSMVFGAIHCIAWSFHFPSHIEQSLWRTASLVVTFVPMLLLAIKQSEIHHWHSGVEIVWVKRLLDGVSFAGIVMISALYGLARVVLLVLAFMSLRSLPSGAYHTVRWTTFIPHI